MEQLASLRPGLVLSSPTWARGNRTMRNLDMRVEVPEPLTVLDMYERIEDIAAMVDRERAGRRLASCSMFGPLGWASGSVRTRRSEGAKFSSPPSVWPIAIGLTFSAASVLAEKGVRATIRLGASAVAGAASAAARRTKARQAARVAARDMKLLGLS